MMHEPMRLSDLTALVSDTISHAFRGRSFWVVAEVTDHNFKADKNYHYFTLVEKHPDTHAILARMSTAAWGQGTAAIADFQTVTGQRFTNDIQILVNVSIQYHPAYGLQLVLNGVDSNFTLGALAREREATLARLVRENPGFIEKAGDTYITQNQRLKLAPVIQRIAVISSSTSAGWQDFQHTLENNAYGYRFEAELYHTIVQGENNIQQLVDRLVDVFKSQKHYDVVVVIRGGGAQTDFLIFDHYLVGKAIARFPIPIFTGIGHQKNETIADLMANRATKTPTKAAELIINHNRTFEEKVLGLQQQMVIHTQQRFSTALQDLGKLQTSISNRSRLLLTNSKDNLVRTHQSVINKSKSILFDRNRQLLTASASLSTKPRLIVTDKAKDIQRLLSSIKVLTPILLKNQRGYLGHHVSMINALSPENTLKRGFAIVKVNNTPVSDPQKIAIGKDIDIILAQKTITATVKSKKDYHGNDFNI